jgi:hypothetical protein
MAVESKEFRAVLNIEQAALVLRKMFRQFRWQLREKEYYGTYLLGTLPEQPGAKIKLHYVGGEFELEIWDSAHVGALPDGTPVAALLAALKASDVRDS